MRKSALILFLLSSLMLLSCQGDASLDDVALSDSTPKLIVRGITVFMYEPCTCQLSYCRQESSFRIMTDDMSRYVSADLSSTPTEVGETVYASSLVWTAAGDIESRNNLALEVVNLEGDTVWLWSSREKVALVLRILE